MKKVINLLFNDFTNDNRVLKESRTLQKNGFDVVLVATHFDKKLAREEKIEGFVVKRVNVGSFKLLPLNLLLFWWHIIKKYNRENIFHCNDLYALPPAWFIKKFLNRNAKIVYDCHEHETEAKIYLGKPVIKVFAKIFERAMIKDADFVITVSKSIAKDYVRLYGISEPQLVLNSPPYQKLRKYDLLRKELGISRDKIIFLFQGGYIPGRGIDSLLNVFKKLRNKNSKLVLAFLVYGEGVEDLKKIVDENDNMYWHEKVSPLEYMKYVSSADWGIYLMENICKNHDYALPNKIFDYVLAGLPVIVSNLKEMSDFVNENKVGIIVNPENEDSVVKVLSKFNSKTKNKYIENLDRVAKKYCWEEQEKVLLKLYGTFK